MDERVRRQLAVLERRSRTLTGAVLAALAFVACYGIMLIEGQIERPAFHFYPWLLALLFYLGGELLALLWFRVLVSQLTVLLAAQPPEPPYEPPLRTPPAASGNVEVIRPGEPEE